MSFGRDYGKLQSKILFFHRKARQETFSRSAGIFLYGKKIHVGAGKEKMLPLPPPERGAVHPPPAPPIEGRGRAG